MTKDDSVKKIFGKTADELIIEAKENAALKEKKEKLKAERLTKETFDNYAGPEELKHLHWLLEQLTDEQLHDLAIKCEVSSTQNGLNRETLTSWLEESNRENFYREYHKLTN